MVRQPRHPHCWGFEITLRHTTLGRTTLNEWSTSETSTWQHKHSKETSMHPAGFEPAIPPSERPQAHALDRAATGIGHPLISPCTFLYTYLYFYTSTCTPILHSIQQPIHFSITFTTILHSTSEHAGPTLTGLHKMLVSDIPSDSDYNVSYLFTFCTDAVSNLDYRPATDRVL